jgi:hypothetical protein
MQKSHGNGHGMMKQKRPGHAPPLSPPRSLGLSSVAGADLGSEMCIRFDWPGMDFSWKWRKTLHTHLLRRVRLRLCDVLVLGPCDVCLGRLGGRHVCGCDVCGIEDASAGTGWRMFKGSRCGRKVKMISVSLLQ